jgi:gamma-D-glutamyl-L-lysine dipeptidyl-peptidase
MRKYSECRKLILIAGLVIITVFLLTCCQSSNIINYQSEIDSISGKWVPDGREGICNVTAKPGKQGAIILSGETTISKAKEDIINTIDNHDIKLIDSIIILPDTIINERYQGLVTLSVINLRKQPDHQAELVSQAILGTPVLILKSEDGWSLIQTPDKYIAWTEKSSLKLMTNTEIFKWKHSERVLFLENSGWIYSSTDKSGVVGDLVAGSILVKTGELNGFSKIVLPDGREGYVEKKMLTDFQSWKQHVTPTGENVTKVASTFLGLPYLWGGTSSKAVDCSGFVRSVFFMNGVILSRDASLQAEHGLEVDISKDYTQLKTGDLLFFGARRVTHVAIYIGDSEYINSSGRVMINSLDSTRSNFSSNRKHSVLAARRIIGIEGDIGIVPVLKHSWY